MKGSAMKKQRGEAVLLVIALTAILGTGMALTAPSIGRYIIISDKDGIVVMDTANKRMERCSVVGSVMTCQQIVAQQ